MLACLLLLAAQGFIEEGIKLFQAGQLQQAAAQFQRAAEQEPENALAWKLLGTSFAALGDHEQAREPLRKACALNPKLPDACFYHARNLYLVNRFEESRKLFESLLASDPQPWRIENGLGLALEALGKAEDAEARYRKSASLNPSSHPNEHPLINLGVLLGRQGRTAGAERVLRTAVEKAPQSTRAWFELGRMLQELGRNPESAAALEKSIAIDPRHWAAHALLGKVYLRLGRTEDGRRHLETGSKGLTQSQTPPHI
ncbi:MAG: tetratricopeptide repeat protein [Acidimicrobiia bacterium]|nr:tetratricopeptide repeat protein [Acidimicrobiia bacterium]